MENAFTKKSDLSAWVKEQKVKDSKAESGKKGSDTFSARFNYQFTSKTKKK